LTRKEVVSITNHLMEEEGPFTGKRNVYQGVEGMGKKTKE